MCKPPSCFSFNVKKSEGNESIVGFLQSVPFVTFVTLDSSIIKLKLKFILL